MPIKPGEVFAVLLVAAMLALTTGCVKTAYLWSEGETYQRPHTFGGTVIRSAE